MKFYLQPDWYAFGKLHYAIKDGVEFVGGEVITIDEHKKEITDLHTKYARILVEQKETCAALVRARTFSERRRAVQIISENAGDSGAAMEQILGEK